MKVNKIFNKMKTTVISRKPDAPKLYCEIDGKVVKLSRRAWQRTPSTKITCSETSCLEQPMLFVKYHAWLICTYV